MWYDWKHDLYPIHKLPTWATSRVLRWLYARSIPPAVVPDIASAAAEAYEQCLASWDRNRGAIEPYVFKSMENRMAQRLDELQIGAQTSRNAKYPNLTYAEANPVVLDHVGYGSRSWSGKADGLTDKAYRDLKAAARYWQHSLRNPSEQQERYLNAMLFKGALSALRVEDKFASEVAWECLVWDKTVTETALKLRARKESVSTALNYANAFLHSRMSIEHPDSSLGELRQVWREEGFEPEWQGTSLIFPIPVEPEELLEEEALETEEARGSPD